MVQSLEPNGSSYRAPYSIQIKLEIKDTVNNTPSNLDRVGESISYNIRGTTLLVACCRPHGINHCIGLTSRLYDTALTTKSAVQTTPYRPYDTASTALTVRHHTALTIRSHTACRIGCTSDSESAVQATPHQPYDMASTRPHYAH
jgi:hypothetical protein